MHTFLRSVKPTPLLNSPDFDRVFCQLPLDSQGLLREVEMVALADTRFTLIQMVTASIAQVETEDYPSKKPLYLDIRFTEESPNAPNRRQILPSPDAILSQLESSLGLPYIWGGNWGEGIPEIRDLYPNPAPSDERTYLLRGVDCSGLLYQATHGYTPRNSSDLVSFGQNVPSLADVKPLDSIVWPGHIIICFDEHTVIESLLGHGVILSNFSERMARLESQHFTIRRFI